MAEGNIHMKRFVCSVVMLLLSLQAFPDSSSGYDLGRVEYMDRFIGSKEAKEMLLEKGFVVTDQQFNQIFGAYIAHDYDRPSPAKFITVDSAWHTYHVLLEESVKQLEEGQAVNLLDFSKQLYNKASELKELPDGIYADLARFAAVAMVMQDVASLESIDQEDQSLVRNIVDKLKQGSGETSVLFFSTPVFAVYFRASSFYTEDEVLRGYFAARQWYAVCNFRAGSKHETERALYLALLIDGDAALKALYKKLTIPYTKLLGSADDAGIEEYLDVVHKIAGKDVAPEAIGLHIEELQTAMAGLPAPKVNDQYFPDRGSYQRWAEASKGFRLFGSRRLASAVVFQNAVDPAIEGRGIPSGLDFFATGPLACEAGKRALQSDAQIRPFAKEILDITQEPLPDSLHGEALNVLSLLQEPLPESAPQPLRTQAWEDKQLWTQLGAWAEQRHTWALHTKWNAVLGGLTEEPPGYVSPYPGFFRELAKLSRNTVVAFKQFDNVELNPQEAGTNVIEGVALIEKRYVQDQEFSDGEYVRCLQFLDFVFHYANLSDRTELPRAGDKEFLQELRALGERWLAGQVDQQNDEHLIRFILFPEGDTRAFLLEFAKLCDSLADIADKELNGIALSEEDALLIEGYGKRLARFHFYGGNSWLFPRDDFPLVTPIFTNPARQETLYAGLPRPEAMYIILDFKGRPVLHRGAVLSYREFLRPMNAPLDDGRWKEEVRAGTVPPPPAFTASFRETISAEEVVDAIKSGGIYRDVDRIPGHEITQAMIDQLLKPNFKSEHKYWLRQSLCRRAKAEDVGSLIELLKRGDVDDVGHYAVCIARLPWRTHRDALMELLHHEKIQYADSAAYIMSHSPADIDVKALLAHFDGQPPRTKRLYCYLLGHSKSQDAIKTLIQSLLSKDVGVRYQAANALGAAGIKNPETVTALTGALDDPNDYVAIEAAISLYHLKAKEAAPEIFKMMQSTEAGNRDRGRRRSHRKEIFDNTSYSGYRSIMVLSEKGRGDSRYVSVKQLKEWAEAQL